MGVTIHDRLMSDVRFAALSNHLGRCGALCLLYDFWKVAQRHWLNNKSHVPEHEYQVIDPKKLLIETQFAQKTESGIYAKGSARRFKGLVARVENGKKGGRPSTKTAPKSGKTARKAHDKKPTGYLQDTYRLPTGFEEPQGSLLGVPDQKMNKYEVSAETTVKQKTHHAIAFY